MSQAPKRITARVHASGIINARDVDDPWRYPTSLPVVATDVQYIRADLVAPLILAASNLRDIETETGLLGPAVTTRIDAVLAALEQYLEARRCLTAAPPRPRRPLPWRRCRRDRSRRASISARCSSRVFGASTMGPIDQRRDELARLRAILAELA